MDEYKKVSNLSENIMIRDLRKVVNEVNKKKEFEKSNKNNNVSQSTCIFCGSKENIFKYKDKYFCRKCYQELKKMNSNLRD